MSADVIQANYEHLEALAGKFGQRAEVAAELYSRVMRGVQALEDGGWEGAGSAAFFAEMQGELYPAMQRLTQVLEEAQAVTLEAKDIFLRAEEEAASVFQGDGSADRDGATNEVLGGAQGPAASGNGGSLWDQFWRSMPGQQGLAVLNAAWAFLAGSGHEFGESYGPGAKVGSFGGDAASSFLIWGDVRDLAVEGFNAIMPGRDANEVTAVLAGIGLAMDLGWLDGPIPDPVDGGNAALAVLKATAKQIDNLPAPTRDAMVGLLKWAKDNPSRIVDVAHLAEWTLKNHDTKLGKAVIGMFHNAIKHNPENFAKAADISKWLRDDPVRFEQLATELGQNNKIWTGSINEARVGLSLEEIGPQAGGLKGPIRRSPDVKVDLLDADNVPWDVKSPNSRQPGRFVLQDEVANISGELRGGTNVIIDTTDLGPREIEDLAREVSANGWGDRIKWHPPR